MARKKQLIINNKQAVIYARFSSDSQREASIEDQIRECKSYAESHGYNIVKVYHDHALTGRSEKRPDFQKMIEESEKGLFDYIICYKTDRFFRNRYEAQKYKKILKENGVKVVYAKVDIPAGPEGIILEGVLEALDEYYSANLSQNIRRGQNGNALKCMSNGVNVFGYSRDENDCYIINDHEAIAVKKIFEMVIDCVSDCEILNWLKINGYKNTKGRDFSKNAISRIISNRKYIGEYSFGDVVKPNGMPAIVNEDTFIKANEIRKIRRTKRMRSSEYILSGVLYCGECGASMYGRCGTSHTGKKHYYYCCRNHVKHECDKHDVKKDVIENAVIDILNKYIFNEENLNAIADGVVEYQEECLKNNNLELLRKQLNDTEKAINNIVVAVEKGLFNDSMIEHMNALEKDKKALKAQIKLEEMDHEILDKEFIKFILNKFKTTQKDTAENKKRLVETFVSKAFLFDDGKLVITFNYRKNGHLATHEEVLENLQNSRVRQITFGGGGGNRTRVQKSSHIELLQLILSNKFN